MSKSLSIVLLSCVLAVSAGGAWSRGDYATLSFTADHSSYTFGFGAHQLQSKPGSLANVTSIAASNGTDPTLGSYDELELIAGSDGSLSVRYFSGMDAFVFVRSPKTASLTEIWPAFSITGVKPGATRCLTWSEHYFYPGGLSINGEDIRCGGQSDGGPVFILDSPGVTEPVAPSAAMVISPLSHFSTNKVVNCPLGKTPPPASECTLGVSSATRNVRTLMWETKGLMLARPALTRSIRAFGSVARQVHNTTRNRGPGVTKLSYWNDNQAGYSWWTAGSDQSIWGTPEDIYLKLKEGYDKAGIPVSGWEPDNNFVVDYKEPKNWIGNNDKEFNKTLYPSGGPGFVSKLGNLSMVYYTNGFGADNVHQKDWHMVGKGEMEPHPNVSYGFHKDVFGNAITNFGMEMLFTDFLCYRGPSMSAITDIPAEEEGEHMWLGGMVRAMQDMGAEVQFCMALAHQIASSLEWPAVTNARANGDGGLAVQSLVLPAVLASSVGLGWSKDNLRTADRCYVNGTYPNGTVKWPCGSSNHGEGTSGQFKMQIQQTMLATLSLGPVGISDQLTAHPSDPAADITSNKSLVMGTCAADGTLLQPSYPLAPIERMITGAGEFGDCFGAKHIAYTYGCGSHVWATYTAVSTAAGAKARTVVGAKMGEANVVTGGATAVWFTAIGFASGRGGAGKGSNVTLVENDLAAMVDLGEPPTPGPMNDGDASSNPFSFSAIPRASFSGTGGTFPSLPSFAQSTNGSGAAYVWWSSAWLQQSMASHSPAHATTASATDACAGVVASPWSAAGVTMKLAKNTDSTSHVNVAPVFTGGVALLGEAGKVTAVSEYRFEYVHSQEGKLQVGLRGKPGEVVTLLFAKQASASASSPAGGFTCVAKPTVIGADGTATAAGP